MQPLAITAFLFIKEKLGNFNKKYFVKRGSFIYFLNKSGWGGQGMGKVFLWCFWWYQ